MPEKKENVSESGWSLSAVKVMGIIASLPLSKKTQIRKVNNIPHSRISLRPLIQNKRNNQLFSMIVTALSSA